MTTNNRTASGLDRPIALAVIVASTREGRRGRALTDWLVARIADRSDIVVDEIDLDDLDLPTRLGFGANAAVEDLRERVQRADAVLVVTPEYNHSYPASLKHAIDFVKEPWRRKPVGFVSYGGVSGGLRAVEHLRGVFNELHAHGVRDTVSFHGPWNGFGDDGRPSDEAGATEALRVVLDDLVWWGSALAVARDATPVAP